MKVFIFAMVILGLAMACCSDDNPNATLGDDLDCKWSQKHGACFCYYRSCVAGGCVMSFTYAPPGVCGK